MDTLLRLLKSFLIQMLNPETIDTPRGLKALWFEENQVTGFYEFNQDGLPVNPKVILTHEQLQSYGLDVIDTDTVDNFITNHLRVYPFDVTLNDGSHSLGYHVITSEGNPAALAEGIERPKMFHEVILRTLYPDNSPMANELKQQYGLSLDEDDIGIYDAKNCIVEYQLNVESDYVMNMLLRNGFYSGYLTRAGFVIGIDEVTGAQKNIGQIEHSPAGELNLSLLDFITLNYSAITQEPLFTEEKNFAVQYKLFNPNTSKMPFSLESLTNGFYYIANNTFSEFLNSLQPCEKLNLCLNFSSERVILTQTNAMVDMIEVIEGVQNKDIKDLYKNLPTICKLYNCIFMPYIGFLPPDILLTLAQSCKVFISVDCNSLYDVQKAIRENPKYKDTILSLLKGIFNINKNFYMTVTDTIRGILNSAVQYEVPLTDNILFNPTDELTLTDAIDLGLKHSNVLSINERGIFLVQNDGSHKLLQFQDVNYQLSNNQLILYLMKLDNPSINNLLASNDSTKYCSVKMDLGANGTPIKLAILVVDNKVSLQVSKITLKADYNIAPVQNRFLQELGIRKGIYFITSPPDEGKKNILKGILNTLPREVVKSGLIYNPDNDIVSEMITNADPSNIVITSRCSNFINIARELQPTLIVLTRVDETDIVAQLQKIVGTNQLIIILSPQKYLIDTLSDLFSNTYDLLDCIDRYFTLSISQVLQMDANGECNPNREIVTRSELLEALNKAKEDIPNIKTQTIYDVMNTIEGYLHIKEKYDEMR